jgi:hypothetical protein
VSEICARLHRIANERPRLRFPFSSSEIPANGIYVLFEFGETGHGYDRITRIGTHTGEDQLESRLRQHFVMKNKDRSIFRKNIGRALLHRENDPFERDWEIDRTSADSKRRFPLDQSKYRAIENAVSTYIRSTCSFCVFAVPDRWRRLSLESKMISTVSSCDVCKPSHKWLGNESPKEKIRRHGLWLVNELLKTPLTVPDLDQLAADCS